MNKPKFTSQAYPQITDNKIITHGEDFADAFITMMEDIAGRQTNITPKPEDTDEQT